MDRQDDRLEKLLNTRAVPEAPYGMAEQIIAMAAAIPRETTRIIKLPQKPWFADLLQQLMIPKPALVFACMLILGIMIGIDMGTPADAASSDWSNLFGSGDGML